jgi:hypothetical protein
MDYTIFKQKSAKICQNSAKINATLGSIFVISWKQPRKNAILNQNLVISLLASFVSWCLRGMETLNSLMLSLLGYMAQTLLMSMVMMSIEFMFNYLCQWYSLIHLRHETCFVNKFKLSIYSGYFFIANLVKFYKTKFLELMLAYNQSYLMSKFVNFNPFPVIRMYFKPTSPLTSLYTFSATSEKNVELSHNFVLLSRFFWRILYGGGPWFRFNASPHRTSFIHFPSENVPLLYKVSFHNDPM